MWSYRRLRICEDQWMLRAKNREIAWREKVKRKYQGIANNMWESNFVFVPC